MTADFFQKQAPPIPPKPKSRVDETTAKLGKVAIDAPKGSGDKHHHNKDKPGPTMRKRSMKKKKMTDEEILAALSQYYSLSIGFTKYTQKNRKLGLLYV